MLGDLGGCCFKSIINSPLVYQTEPLFWVFGLGDSPIKIW
uniref:Uncharacterized protein n=1 Tax=Enterococcus faecalis TaxID=1351 RepID=Q9F1H4_ENTFL|nr:hypothetical protein [Enterococcus faecalis]